MQKIDFYQGFEGYPALIILQKQQGKIITQWESWMGYVDGILESIPPNAQGNWEGITLHYHLETGWYEEEDWLCQEKELFAQQLESINPSTLGKVEQQVLKTWIQLLQNSIAANDELYFYED